MADKDPGWGPSDLFGLGANFHEQSSSSVTTDETVMIRDASGNVECETTGLNTTTEHQGSYGYCNASPDIETDLSTLLTAFGDVFTSKLVAQIVVNFQAGEYATVDVTGHNHAEQAHASGDLIDTANMTTGDGDLIPAGAGFGVPTWAGMSFGTDATPVSATLTLTMEHIDRVQQDGNHWVGKNLTPKAELSMEFIGEPATPALTGWTIDSFGTSDNIDDPDGYNISAHRNSDLTV